MSAEHVEQVRRGIEAFNRREVDRFAELATADFEWFPALPGAVEGASYRGREGIRRYFEESRETWERLRIVIVELRDLGERVLVLGVTEGLGRGSGVAIEMPLGVLVEFRDGAISRARTYRDHGEALRAAGLSA